MLKLLAIILLFVLFLRGIGFVIRLLVGGASRPNQQFHRTQSKRPSGSNINVDYAPKSEQKSSRKFKGGEYVDFEDVD